MKLKLVAIDLAKLVFQVCIISVSGKVRSNKKYTREKFVELLKDLAPTTIAMEACATAHYWGRRLQAAGHVVKLVPAQHVETIAKGAIWLDVNGVRKQTGDLAQMIWDVPHQIEFLSTLFELKPGDLIFTGTPAGVGAIMKGDRLKGHVDGVGDLEVAVV